MEKFKENTPNIYLFFALNLFLFLVIVYQKKKKKKIIAILVGSVF